MPWDVYSGRYNEPKWVARLHLDGIHDAGMGLWYEHTLMGRIVEESSMSVGSHSHQLIGGVMELVNPQATRPYFKIRMEIVSF